MEALHEGLQMDVLGAALLTFERAVDSIHAAKDAPHGGSIAAKGIHAGIVGLRAVGAIAAVAHAKEVPQREQYQCLKAFCASQGVPGKQCFPLIIGQQLLAKAGTAGFLLRDMFPEDFIVMDSELKKFRRGVALQVIGLKPLLASWHPPTNYRTARSRNKTRSSAKASGERRT